MMFGKRCGTKLRKKRERTARNHVFNILIFKKITLNLIHSYSRRADFSMMVQALK